MTIDRQLPAKPKKRRKRRESPLQELQRKWRAGARKFPKKPGLSVERTPAKYRDLVRELKKCIDYLGSAFFKHEFTPMRLDVAYYAAMAIECAARDLMEALATDLPAWRVANVAEDGRIRPRPSGAESGGGGA